MIFFKDNIFSDSCTTCSLPTYRGCVTNGEYWAFLIFNAGSSGEGGTVSISMDFCLGEDLSNLPLVLGLLSDWVGLDFLFLKAPI